MKLNYKSFIAASLQKLYKSFTKTLSKSYIFTSFQKNMLTFYRLCILSKWIKSILIHEYQRKSTRVNTSPTRVNTSGKRVNTSPTEVNTNKHKSKRVLDGLT